MQTTQNYNNQLKASDAEARMIDMRRYREGDRDGDNEVNGPRNIRVQLVKLSRVAD